MILNKVLKREQSIEIEPRRQPLRIDPVERKPKLERLTDRPYLKVAPDELVHLDWSGEGKF